jgi:hypothetical protein
VRSWPEDPFGQRAPFAESRWNRQQCGIPLSPCSTHCDRHELSYELLHLGPCGRRGDLTTDLELLGSNPIRVRNPAPALVLHLRGVSPIRRVARDRATVAGVSVGEVAQPRVVPSVATRGRAIRVMWELVRAFGTKSTRRFSKQDGCVVATPSSLGFVPSIRTATESTRARKERNAQRGDSRLSSPCRDSRFDVGDDYAPVESRASAITLASK